MRFLLALLMMAAPAAPAVAAPTLFKPAQVFDSEAMHIGWQVLSDGDRIIAAGPADAHAR